MLVYRSPTSTNEFFEYYKFRWKVLRKPLNLPLGSEQDDLDKKSFHIAAFNDEIIIGAGRLQIEENACARIRYMAVEQKFRKQGIGRNILKQLEKHAILNNVQICWLYARESAINFYLKNNYVVNGTADNDLSIKHIRMEKKLL